MVVILTALKAPQYLPVSLAGAGLTKYIDIKITSGHAVSEIANEQVQATATRSDNGTVIAGTIGSLGLILVGHVDVFNWNCWKKVVHDKSENNSDGILLRDLINDKNVKSLCVKQTNNNTYLILENKWNEKFCLIFFYFNDQIVGHIENYFE